MVVYCKNYTENIYTRYEKNAEALMLNLALLILTTTLAKVNTLEDDGFQFYTFIWNVPGREKYQHESAALDSNTRKLEISFRHFCVHLLAVTDVSTEADGLLRGGLSVRIFIK